MQPPFWPIHSSAVGGLTRLLARGLLSAIFIRSGLRVLRDPAGPAAQAAKAMPWLPQPHLVARAQAAVHVAGGVALTAGIAPRLVASTLAATLLPTTYAGHGFWRESDAMARNAQITHFLKNCGLLGGLLTLAMQSPRARTK
jgi:uncharacterized membrane protein YphA (DoxX/SURF4 family)